MVKRRRVKKAKSRRYPSPLVKACGWEGKRVPKAWVELPAGRQYGGEKCAKLAGERVRGRGGDWVVRGCATPVKPRAKAKRRGRKYTCQGAYVLSDARDSRSTTVMPKSVVRERLRKRAPLCDRQATWLANASPADLRAIERDAKANGVHPWELVGDLEFPHRRGSSPCCSYSPDYMKNPEACWRGLVRRVENKQASAGMSTARTKARFRARLIREGGDEGSADYRETLSGRRRRAA